MKNIKKFFTMSRRANGGFTLVELIVVIAILAILGGVAVPAYSGYIKKAHMAADQTMASDVAKALQLQYYSNPNQAVTTYVVITQKGAGTTDATVGTDGTITVGALGGPIVLSETPVVADEASAVFADKAMTAVFGENWEETVKLESGDWADLAANGIQDDLAANDGALAKAVTNSSYMTGTTPDALLNNAAQVTGAALNFLTKKAPNMNADIYYSGIQGAFGQDEETFNKMCADYGIEVKEDANGNSVFGDDVTATQLSNLMVVAAANDLNNERESTASLLVLQYAAFAGAVNSPYATAETKAAYDTLNATLNSASSMAEIQTAMDTFAQDEGYIAYSEGPDTAVAEGDGAAFMGIMDALDTAAAGLSDKAGLVASGNAFSSGEVVGAFNSYIALAAAIASGEIDATELGNITNAGGVVIMLTVTANGCVVGATPAEVLPW